MIELKDSFRCAMRGLASTVCVISAPTPAGPRGMTATAVMSLSMDPPALALAINRSASMNSALIEGAPLSVHLLSEEQAELARAFAGGLPADKRFAIGGWSADAWGSPMLEDASANLSCVVERRVELTTHSLLIATVRGVRTSPDARPLLYAHGAFTGLAGPECSRAA